MHRQTDRQADRRGSIFRRSSRCRTTKQIQVSHFLGAKQVVPSRSPERHRDRERTQSTNRTPDHDHLPWKGASDVIYRGCLFPFALFCLLSKINCFFRFLRTYELLGARVPGEPRQSNELDGQLLGHRTLQMWSNCRGVFTVKTNLHE